MFNKARRLLLRLPKGSLRRAMPMLREGMAGLALVSTAPAALATPPDIIVGAEYIEPVSRYGHNVLGDAAEWGALRLTVDKCLDCEARQIVTVVIRLPETRVFEDVAPRLIDLDHDDIPEVVVVESDLSQGARLAVYNEVGLITATPFIGQPYRWLAPLGAADLDGDGAIELAYIDRPHLAKILRIWRYQNRALQEIAQAPGLTNHRIGETTISGGIRDCGAGPEIITADAGWRQVMATRFAGGKLTTTPINAFAGLESLSAALNCR